MTTPTTPTTPGTTDAIRVSKPTASYTVGGDWAHIQFQRLSPRSGEWIRESYSQAQAALSARAKPEVLAILPGYWGDDEVSADALAFLAEEYGITNAVIVDPIPPQPDVPVGKITLAPHDAATEPSA